MIFIPRGGFIFGPDGGTRTHDLRYPKPSRYQTALHPDYMLSNRHGFLLDSPRLDFINRLPHHTMYVGLFWQGCSESNRVLKVLEARGLPFSLTPINFGSLTWARTKDRPLNRRMLYQLSYQETISVCNYTDYFRILGQGVFASSSSPVGVVTNRVLVTTLFIHSGFMGSSQPDSLYSNQDLPVHHQLDLFTL